MRYWSGFATGIIAIALAAFAVIATRLPSFGAMYAEFRAETLPLPTRIALSPLWSVSVLAVLVTSALLVNLRWKGSEPARVTALGAIALLALLTAGATIAAAYLPVYDLAGNIE